jgi:hypothetical protein
MTAVGGAPTAASAIEHPGTAVARSNVAVGLARQWVITLVAHRWPPPRKTAMPAVRKADAAMVA